MDHKRTLSKSSSYDQPQAFGLRHKQTQQVPPGQGIYNHHAQNVPMRGGVGAQNVRVSQERKYFNVGMRPGQNPEDGVHQSMRVSHVSTNLANPKRPLAGSQSFQGPQRGVFGNSVVHHRNQENVQHNNMQNGAKNVSKRKTGLGGRDKNQQSAASFGVPQTMDVDGGATIGSRSRRKGSQTDHSTQAGWNIVSHREELTAQALPDHSVPLRRDNSRTELSQRRKPSATSHHSRKSSVRMVVDHMEVPAPNTQRQSSTWKPFGSKLTIERVTAGKAEAPLITLGSTRLSDYTKISVLGKGTYGEVHKCVHNPTNSVVAMKTFLFENVSNGINYSTMREISLLRQLVDYEQFVRLLDILEEENSDSKKIHCIFEFCDKVLSNELNHRKKPAPIEQTKKVIRQLLEAVDILHAKMIMHRDIKPDNILIDKHGKLKLADFGLAKKASFLQRRKSNAIVSLWYRAPEIILGSEEYLFGVDIWSVGCILAELLHKRPIFMCRSEDEVLAKVFSMLGCPSQTHCPMYLRLPKFHLAKWQAYQSPQIVNMFPDAPPLAMDLLQKMLHIDPQQRILAREALQHPFLAQ